MSLLEGEEALKGKSRIVFDCGFRRMEATPIFSTDDTGDKHKLLRFLYPGSGVFFRMVEGKEKNNIYIYILLKYIRDVWLKLSEMCSFCRCAGCGELLRAYHVPACTRVGFPV